LVDEYNDHLRNHEVPMPELLSRVIEVYVAHHRLNTALQADRDKVATTPSDSFSGPVDS
jgi:hypothetical protein